MGDSVGKQRIRTADATDVKVGVVDATGAFQLDIDLNGKAATRIYASNGDALLEDSGRLQIDVASQTLAALKISRDGLAPTAANGNFAELTTLGAIVAVGNPLPVSLGGLGGAVGTPLWVRPSDGTNPFGTETNPFFVTEIGDPTPETEILRERKDTVAADSEHTTVGQFIEFVVPNTKIFKLHFIQVSCPEASHFELTWDAAGAPDRVLTMFCSPGSTQHAVPMSLPKPLTFTGDGVKILRLRRFNDSHQPAEMAATFFGTHN